MFILQVNKNFLIILYIITISLCFTYKDIKAQSLNISLANAYSNHPLLFSERIG